MEITILRFFSIQAKGGGYFCTTGISCITFELFSSNFANSSAPTMKIKFQLTEQQVTLFCHTLSEKSSKHFRKCFFMLLLRCFYYLIYVNINKWRGNDTLIHYLTNHFFGSYWVFTDSLQKIHFRHGKKQSETFSMCLKTIQIR